MTDNGGAMNELQDLVLKRLDELGGNDGPMSLREAAARADGLISYETIRAILRGTHSGRLADRTIEGLARALQLPAERIYTAARQPQPQSRWQWPERFDRLDQAQRRLIEDMAGALLEAYDKGRRSQG